MQAEGNVADSMAESVGAEPLGALYEQLFVTPNDDGAVIGVAVGDIKASL